MRRLINAGVSVFIALTLALLSTAPVFADVTTTNWLEEVKGYSGEYDNWGDSLVYWWGEKLGIGEDANITVVSTPFYYVECGEDTGIIAMDDACWIPSSENQSGYDRYSRTLEGVVGPSQVSPSEDADLKRALLYLNGSPWPIVLAAGAVVGVVSGGIVVFAMRSKKKSKK